MEIPFSDRMADVPKSFIREILKTTVRPEVISFAGGLPNRTLFPVEEVKNAASAVLDEYGAEALQYATSEGLAGLRSWISRRYRERQGLAVPEENIIITTGSQQGLDLIAKILVNDGDCLGIEEPGYLGAIQAFSLYRPRFCPVQLNWDGLDHSALQNTLALHRPKLFYAVPNFQNPSGISHSNESRDRSAELFREYGTLLVEDNPYGEIQFSGSVLRSYAARIPEQTILLGSFSKIFVPGFRLGWIAAPDYLIEKLIVAKQAADLHTNYFSQRILLHYLENNSIDDHIERICAVYARQKDAMMQAIQNYFPNSVQCSRPDGGMFLWAELPPGMNARALFDKAIEQNVAFVPGDPFYTDGRSASSMRLNFSCVNEKQIETGIEQLGKLIYAELS
ncbi:aminotransferase-like domain-containing protein [Spirochaeta dissipatitropha]